MSRYLAAVMAVIYPSLTGAPSLGAQPAKEAAAAIDPLPPGALVRLGTTRFRHPAPITWAGFAAGGKMLITDCMDETVRLWNLATGKEVAGYRSSTRAGIKTSFGGRLSVPRLSFALSANGKVLALAKDGELIILDAATGKQIRKLPGRARPLDSDPLPEPLLHLSPDGRYLLIMERLSLSKKIGQAPEKEEDQEMMNLWDLESGQKLRRWKKPRLEELEGLRYRRRAAFTPDGRMLAFLEGDGKDDKIWLRFQETVSGNDIRRIALPHALSQWQFLPDGTKLVGLQQSQESLSVYDAASGKELRALPDKGFLATFALSPDGLRLAVSREEGFTVRPLAGGKALLDVPFPVGLPAAAVGHALAFSPDGQVLALARGHQIQLWHLATGKSLLPETPGGPVLAVHVHGRHLVARDIYLGLSLWDVRTGKLQRRFGMAQAPGGRGQLVGLMDIFKPIQWYGGLQAISPDGKKLAAVWAEAPIHIWDLASGKKLFLLEGSDQASCLAISPNGKFLAAPGPDGGVSLWDLSTGKRAQRLAVPGQPAKIDPEERDGRNLFLALRFSRDGKTLAASVLTGSGPEGRCETLFWEMASGSLRRRWKTELKINDDRLDFIQGILDLLENLALSYDYSPDGNTLATAGLRTIRLRQAATGKELRQFGGSQVSGPSAQFSPDGKLLAAGLGNGGIRFWGAAGGAILRDVPAHEDMVTALAFAADGKTLASSSVDGTVIVWDVAQLLKAVGAAQVRLRPEELEQFWKDLAHADAARAGQVMQILAARPQEASAFFKDRLAPIAAPDPGKLKQMLADLDHDKFAVRQKAVKDLEKLGELARAVLEKALAGPVSLETRQRVEVLLHKLQPPITVPALLRQVRAVEVLEQIATPEARRLLEALAAGAPGHRVTEDAREALGRLGKR